MKKIAFAAAGLAVLAAAPLTAQQPAPARTSQPITRAFVQTQVQAQFAKLDTNRDGFVTKAEAEASRAAVRAERQETRGDRREARFARLDADKSGSISEAEFNAPRQRGGAEERKARRAERFTKRSDRHGKGFAAARLGARFFERADGNNDGRLSLAEATAAPLAKFDRADANRDGTVTREEMRAARPARGQNRAPAQG